MGKLLLILSAFSLVFLGVGTAAAPSDAMFWLASAALLYQKARGILISLLLLQFMTNPPRHFLVRFFTGIAATCIGIWTLHETLNFTMPALDTFAFLSGSIALMVTSLERSLDINPPKRAYSIKGLQGHPSA